MNGTIHALLRVATRRRGNNTRTVSWPCMMLIKVVVMLVTGLVTLITCSYLRKNHGGEVTGLLPVQASWSKGS